MNIIETQLEFGNNHSNRIGAPTGIVLHHAAVSEATVEAIHNYHRHENGWAGIGYHFYVRKDGKVYRGRPEAWLGAHTVGHNEKIGICAEGDFVRDTMGEKQQKALSELLMYLFDKYGERKVYAHRDLDNTTCPGERYPFAAVIGGVEKYAVSPQNNVMEFQTAALADGLTLPVYGADGIWGDETASAAAANVQYGDKGERVRLLQQLLIEQGYNLRVYGADAHFGGETQSAVKAFQKRNRLAVDGIVGINTWKALLGV